MRLQLRAAIEEEAHRKACRRVTLASKKTTLHDPNLKTYSETCLSHKKTLGRHNLRNDVHKSIGAETGVERDLKMKSGEHRLPVFAESPIAKSMSKVCDMSCTTNLQWCSQDEPEYFTQLSELALLTAPGPRRSERSRTTRRDRDVEYSEEKGTRLDSEKENSINLDSQCSLWSHRKKLFSAATETTKVGSKRAAKDRSLSREEVTRNELDGDFLISPGVATTETQSSSPFTVVKGPPRFSQLLTQASQSHPRTLKATQTTIHEIEKRKSEVLYPARPSKTTVTVRDDDQRATFGKSNLREQILACLMEPDFEDFVADVEMVWEEIQESISDNLEQGARYPFS